MMPRKGWTTYEKVRLLITCDSFEKAKQHEEMYVTTGCLTTDLESEEEADVRRKRRTRPNPLYMESDGEPETSSVKRKFAKPPAIHFPVLPESNQYPSLPTPDASSASGGNYSEDVQSFDQPNNGFCGNILAELESTDLCNDGMPMYNSSPYHIVPSEQARNDISPSYANGSTSAEFRSPGPGSAPDTPRGRFHGREPSQMLQDIAANKNTKMLTELLMEVKQMSRDIQFIKTEIAKSSMNIPRAGPASWRETPFPIVLPLANEEQFDEAEAALKEETVRRMMRTHRAVGESSTAFRVTL
ncbi:uncharacterized protein LOC127360921 [Dicentrarchus labrax]|uniref:uncharacterized protein LOC127360921 n=1 Tax=Dicentrarchus labrax TaxID=13489 RepID=UPI0021F68FD4|nr:uncharacterized protein LOC127360921 [Dicentrarchus labrax]